MFNEWQFIVLEDGQLWVNGIKKRDEKAMEIVKRAIQMWNPEKEEGRGYLEKRDNDFIFHPSVIFSREEQDGEMPEVQAADLHV